MQSISPIRITIAPNLVGTAKTLALGSPKVSHLPKPITDVCYSGEAWLGTFGVIISFSAAPSFIFDALFLCR
jgi:hypothetical protein